MPSFNSANLQYLPEIASTLILGRLTPVPDALILRSHVMKEQIFLRLSSKTWSKCHPFPLFIVHVPQTYFQFDSLTNLLNTSYHDLPL
jgi:hypothetical protein